MTGDRGQLVLLAAAIAALALVPMAVAFLQLGAHPDVVATAEPAEADAAALRALDRAVVNASSAVSGSNASASQATALATFDDALAGDVRSIERSRVRDSVAVGIRRNWSVATEWAGSHCPSGPNRAFGDCTAENGVVTQTRAGEIHVLAAVFDVVVTEPRGTSELTVVVTVQK